MEDFVAGEEEGFSGEGEEFGFAGRAAGVEDVCDLPAVIGARSDDVSVHRPVVILTESETVGRVVVVALGEGNEVGSVDEGDVVSFW